MKYNRFMGEYDDNTIYQAGDVVNFDGASYYRKVPGKGISPIARKKPYTVWSRLNEALSTIFPLGGTGGGASLPTAAPYQQLVTDGSGATGWAERLAWKEVEEVELRPETSVSSETSFLLSAPFEEGKEYTVIWDGVTYKCIAREYEGYIMIGNNAIYEYDDGATEDTGEPFAIDNEKGYTEGFVYVASDDTNVHTLIIKGPGEAIRPIPEEYLPKSVHYYYASKDNLGMLVTDVLYKDRDATEAVSAKELSEALSSGIVRINLPSHHQNSWRETVAFTNRYVSETNYTVSVTFLIEGDSNEPGFGRIAYNKSDK